MRRRSWRFVIALVLAGCGKDAEPPPAVPPEDPDAREAASAMQETVAFLESADPAPAEICRRATELAKRWNDGGAFSKALRARPATPRFAEALFLICYGAHLGYGVPNPIETRLASYEARKLTGYPETAEALRSAWKELESCLRRLQMSGAYGCATEILAQLWLRLKEKDAGVQDFLKRVGNSAGAPILLAFLDRQPYGAFLTIDPVDADHPLPLRKDGSPRYDREAVNLAINKGIYPLLHSCLSDMDPGFAVIGCAISGRPDQDNDPGPKLGLKVRYAIKENGKSLAGFGNRMKLASLDADLRLQFVQDGKPLGPELLVHGTTSDKISWNLATEDAETVLLQNTLAGLGNSLFPQLTNPR